MTAEWATPAVFSVGVLVFWVCALVAWGTRRCPFLVPLLLSVALFIVSEWLILTVAA